MFLIGVASITFAQVQSVPQADTALDPLGLVADLDRMSTEQPIMVAQAQAQAPAQDMTCRNPKTGQPDRLVQCLVSPCRDFKPPSPYAICTDNFCGGCHAILCGVLLEDVGSLGQPTK
jgi:hypothetical protein